MNLLGRANRPPSYYFAWALQVLDLGACPGQDTGQLVCGRAPDLESGNCFGQSACIIPVKGLHKVNSGPGHLLLYR